MMALDSIGTVPGLIGVLAASLAIVWSLVRPRSSVPLSPNMWRDLASSWNSTQMSHVCSARNTPVYVGCEMQPERCEAILDLYEQCLVVRWLWDQELAHETEHPDDGQLQIYVGAMEEIAGYYNHAKSLGVQTSVVDSILILYLPQTVVERIYQ